MSLPSFRVDPLFRTPRIALLEVRERRAPGGTEGTVDLTSAPPLATLLVERTETQRLSADGVVMEARFELAYQRLGMGTSRHVPTGTFLGGYSRFNSGQVSITSGSLTTEGGVFLDLPGLQGMRIGTYLMNQVVLWVKQWPQAQVATVHLYASDTRHIENQARRNRLYEQFGLTFDYDNTSHDSGRSRPMLASDLVPCDAWQQNISVHDVPQGLDELLQANTQAQQELALRQRALKSLHADIRAAEARPLRWAARELWRKALARCA